MCVCRGQWALCVCVCRGQWALTRPRVWSRVREEEEEADKHMGEPVVGQPAAEEAVRTPCGGIVCVCGVVCAACGMALCIVSGLLFDTAHKFLQSSRHCVILS